MRGTEGGLGWAGTAGITQFVGKVYLIEVYQIIGEQKEWKFGISWESLKKMKDEKELYSNLW